MAVETARQPTVDSPSLFRRVVDFYHGVMAEMRKVTWPERAQVQQATIAIILFVLALAVLIAILDWALNGLLNKLIPSLFTGGH